MNATLLKILPGPNRKRKPGLYAYRVTYRNPDGTEPGCVITWGVSGGRAEYQVALERIEPGSLKWHCSCADAVYRGEDDPKHLCKHVTGLLDCLPLAA